MPERCEWVPEDDQLYVNYHDIDWGTPVHDDRRLFELLTLEGAQAGLSWRTILGKRQNYRTAFRDFDPIVVAAFGDRDLENLLQDTGLVRNRLKLSSTIQNAQALIAIQTESGSFDSYLWARVDGRPVVGAWERLDDIPTTTDLARDLSRDLKRRGFNFVGPTIVYSFLQAVGVVNDHVVRCFRFAELTG